MTLAQRITREPALVLGVVTAGLGLLVLFGVEITKDQLAGITLFLGALMALVRFLVTPASEVAAQKVPGKAGAQAGPAASIPDGTPVGVVTQQGEQVA